jgi:hypothetical protein
MSRKSSRYTIIDDFDSSCSLTYATLCIYFIDPDLVTQKLGINPTGRQKKGCISDLPNGSQKIGTVNSWLLSSEKYVSSKDMRTHLDWLLNKVEPTAAQILEIQQIRDIKITVRSTWFSAEGLGGPTLWPEQMERMAKLNLECAFSFADYSEEKNVKRGQL